MCAVSKIEEKCRKYPNIKYNKDATSITALPINTDGFPVSYYFSNSLHTVGFAGWHEEFSDEAEALSCFAFGLSNKCRLKVMQKGNFAYKWTVEAKDKNGEWSEDSTTGLLFFPFWKKSTTAFLQNNFIVDKE